MMLSMHVLVVLLIRVGSFIKYCRCEFFKNCLNLDEDVFFLAVILTLMSPRRIRSAAPSEYMSIILFSIISIKFSIEPLGGLYVHAM